MPARLVSSNGLPDIVIDRPLIVVGRHRTCDERLDSSRVSRHHCCLVVAGEAGLLVRDLGSTNGTWINGRQIVDGRLHPGDELAVACLRYRLIKSDSSGDSDPDAIGDAPRPAHAAYASARPPGGPSASTVLDRPAIRGADAPNGGTAGGCRSLARHIEPATS
jgi:hypothetical protein